MSQDRMDIARAFHCHVTTVQNVRRHLVEQGLEAAVERAKHKAYKPRTLDGRAEAKLVATACSEPPAGRSKWTLRLLADEMVELEIVDSISFGTVRNVLKKRHKALAEMELSVLARQCLDQYFETRDELDRVIQAWREQRDTGAKAVDWQFTNTDARIKLKQLYHEILF